MLTDWRQTGIQLPKQQPGYVGACVCSGKLTWMHLNPQETRGGLESPNAAINWLKMTGTAPPRTHARTHIHMNTQPTRCRSCSKQDTFTVIKEASGPHLLSRWDVSQKQREKKNYKHTQRERAETAVTRSTSCSLRKKWKRLDLCNPDEKSTLRLQTSASNNVKKQDSFLLDWTYVCLPCTLLNLPGSFSNK